MKETIKRLLKEKNAILLAHNYQPPEIQDIADLCGDSLELSIKASKTDADIIVFCGVQFMAESAAILAKENQVVQTPEPGAGCWLSDMIRGNINGFLFPDRTGAFRVDQRKRRTRDQPAAGRTARRGVPVPGPDYIKEQ